MLKKKKTTASGKLVLVKSVRRTRSHRMKFCVQRGLGRCPQQASGEENHGGIFFSAGLCVLTQAFACQFCLGAILTGSVYPKKCVLVKPAVKCYP